jgi:hypothetical protein
VTLTEQAQVISALQAKQPPADVATLLADFHAAIDRNLAWQEWAQATQEHLATLYRTVEDVRRGEEPLRVRLAAAEQNAVPNLEAAARIATLEMRNAELTSRLAPVPDEVTARLEAEAQMRASFWEWASRVHPGLFAAWEAEQSITPTTGGDEEP